MTEVLSRGAYIMQKDLREFESAFARFVGCRHAVGVANCTDGLQLALMACGVAPGDEVILPSHTFVATAGAINACGAVPVVVDSGPDHMIDVSTIEAAITEKTRFLMPVQLNGRVADMDPMLKLAAARNLTIVEDAAQALGASYKGKQAGTFGRASAFSFYPAKLLGCFGDGGMVVTDDEAVAAQVTAMRDHGRSPEGRITQWGLNSRLDNVQAAVLHHQFRSYEKTIEHRRGLAQRYDEGLSGIGGLVLPPGPAADPERIDVFQNYEIEGDRRDELKEFLGEHGVGTLIQWGGQPVHAIKELAVRGDAPNTTKIFERCLLLPMNQLLSEADVDHVIAVTREFYDAR
ncbi:MAG: DegT/DnrJ/EryC1/StrS family aminotransferase [Nannocystaceae bacterium]|nr:DegT/DnrJ/EryC1/StrS family aminotransferase [Nannocystaceae bacterium]